MKVILIQDVKKQGKKDDIIEVSDGYAINYLIKNKLAVKYTSGSSSVLKKELDDRKEKEDNLIKKCNEIKDKLEGKEIKFKVKVGKEDKVFGNISVKQICGELNNIGYNIDKKCIKIDGDINTLGTHLVQIELHKKVIFNINVILYK